MAAVRTHDREAPTCRVRADDVAHVAKARPRLDKLNCLGKALPSTLHQAAARFVDGAAQHSFVQVAVEAVEIHRYVKVYNVAIFERPHVRDAVADHLVHAGATRLWERAIVERRWIAATRHRHLVGDAVELIGGDSRAHCGGARVEHFAALSGMHV